MENVQWEELPDARYEAKLVEIHAVEGRVEARGGISVSANGLRGRALWDDEQGMYAVRTFQGLQLDLPEENLREFARPRPEDGGYDYAWPVPGYEEEFSVRVADTIRKKGYVVVQMFGSDELRQEAVKAARERDDFVLPKPEFEESFLGREANSKVSSVRQGEPTTAIEFCNLQVKQMATALFGVTEDFFGFTPDNYRSGTMVRVPLQSQDERRELSPWPLQQAEVDDGLVENQLDFIQRRKLCIMYLVENRGGTLELYPRQDLRQPDVVLPLTPNKIVVFRHDLMGYAYRPTGTYDLVVQSWFMEEQQKLRLDGFKGSQVTLEEALGLGNIPIDGDTQVQIMGGNCRMPGGSYQIDRYWAAFSAMVDGFVDIPNQRWDMVLYYNPDSEQFGAQGRSVTRHAGMMADEELLLFDNAFFGLSAGVADCMAPSQRILMEIGFELLHMVGYEKLTSMRGENIGCTVAECALDFDPWHRFGERPEEWLQAQFNFGTSAARLAQVFGLTGPLQQVDTACSSSLVSHNISHSKIRKNNGVERIFSLGHQTLNMPFGFVGLSGAGMLGRTGRCLTFDQSANGMARAEGCGGLFLKSTTDPAVISDRLGVYVSSFINQDGRSASLTAPNGPSQQLCMRSSMKDGRLGPADICVNENHGTGTALGDPIETGSVRSIFRGRGDVPIPVTSSKSNLGHQESTAGSNGLLRTLTSLLNGTIPSTVHVRQLNQHLDLEGFPGCFPSENLDLNKENNIGGLNSFGFGGTNSRAELWVHALQGPRGSNVWFRQTDKRRAPALSMEKIRKMDCVAVLCPSCSGPMCWLCSAALPAEPLRGKHRCATVREEHASYERCSNCYDGLYSFGTAVVDSADRGDKVYVTGTWNAWASAEEMCSVGEGVYTADVVLGDTCVEEFHLVLEKDPQRVLFPIVARAGSRARIVGPAKQEPGKNWFIDGRRDGACTGSVYRLKLEWGEAQRRVSWERLGKRAESQPHNYSIISSLTGFRPVLMGRSEERWEFSGKMTAREELFMFQRDRDPRQLLYPQQHRPAAASVPVLGPDAGPGTRREMRLWAVQGKPGDVVIVRLQVHDGDIEVAAISEAQGARTWRGGRVQHKYFVRGSWSIWALEEMEPDMADLDVCRLHFSLPSGGYSYEESGMFQIIVDGDASRVLHPASTRAAPGQALVEGPDAGGEGCFWEVRGAPGQSFEVTLNLGAQDATKLVTCRPVRRLSRLPQ
uniref:Type I polyketide synthase n=1 Tax=Gambierdiscus excentricus TaxID=986170 RepID=A0A1S6K879_9DINO|nr:type I polyketide synthase [Gambierdiscus excentricus]